MKKKVVVVLSLVCTIFVWAPSGSVKELMKKFEQDASGVVTDIKEAVGMAAAAPKTKPAVAPKPGRRIGEQKPVPLPRPVKKKPPVPLPRTRRGNQAAIVAITNAKARVKPAVAPKPGRRITDADVKNGDLKIRHTTLKDLSGLQSLKDKDKIRFVDLCDNQIEEIPKGCFKGFDNLKTVLLSRNKIKQIDIGMLDYLGVLSDIDLSHNEIESIAPDSFAGTNFSESLALDHNKLRRLVKNTFAGMARVRERDLNQNLKGVGQFPFLDLGDNQIQDIEEGAFTGVDYVERVWLKGNPLSEISKRRVKAYFKDKRSLDGVVVDVVMEQEQPARVKPPVAPKPNIQLGQPAKKKGRKPVPVPKGIMSYNQKVTLNAAMLKHQELINSGLMTEELLKTLITRGGLSSEELDENVEQILEMKQDLVQQMDFLNEREVNMIMRELMELGAKQDREPSEEEMGRVVEASLIKVMKARVEG